MVSRLRVLLVDDARSERLLLRHALTDVDRQLEIREAGDAAAALALYQRHPFDLVFVDIRMPGRDGLSLCRELRTFDRRAAVAVVSHYSTREHVLQARDLGALDFLVKPFAPARLEQLLKRVRRVLRDDGASGVPDAAGGPGDPDPAVAAAEPENPALPADGLPPVARARVPAAFRRARPGAPPSRAHRGPGPVPEGTG